MLNQSADRSAPTSRTAQGQRIFAVSLIALVLGFLMVVQIRSQAQVNQSLATQDNTSVALLINDLNRANADLVAQGVTLAQRQTALQQSLNSGSSDTQALDREVTLLGIVGGLVPVHGPGLQIRIDGQVMDFELQDALNGLRNAGAEAVSLNGYRVVASTAIVTKGGNLTIAGHMVLTPFTLRVIGDPEQLQSAAELSASSLQTRVQVQIDRKDDLAITEVLTPQPLIYAQLGG